ncbi:MAG: PspA/IM30 family protein [Oscillospiraceae bacterium]|nr:PspA/IM30 family protein [Oscillospiraceae bacterium]
MAGILSRTRDILSSNINALLDKCEDPAKMIDQLLRDARKNLADVKRESANVIAQETAALRALEKERADVLEYTKATKAALVKGNEADALKLAERVSKEEAELVQAEKVYAMCRENADNMRAMFKKLSADVQLLEGKRANLKGLVAASKAQETVNKMASKTTGGMATKIDDMERKIQARFDAANAMASLDAEVGDEAAALMSKYSDSNDGIDVIARLKSEMGLTESEVPCAEAEDVLERFRSTEE